MPHSTGSSTPDTLPPFPTHLPLAPIQRISLEDLLKSNPTATDSLWTASTTHGFFYLDLTAHPTGQTLLSTASALESLSHPAFRLPLPQKQSCASGKHRSLFGWKAAGITAQADTYKRKDVGEFWNISKDDTLGLSEKPVPYPDLIQDARPLLREFSEAAHGVGCVVLELLAGKLGIAKGELSGRHRIGEKSGDHVRLTFGPGDAEAAGEEQSRDEGETKITTFAHTDFGSVTLLFNWLGGLQIENQNSNEWEWVQPVEGCAICNLGDAMVGFSGERLKSGKHRVVAAPGGQAAWDRYSVVYFVRPEDEVVLEDVTPGAVREPGEERWKAGDWINHRATQLGNTVGKRA